MDGRFLDTRPSLEDYEVCEDGTIITKESGHVRKPQPNSKGYLRLFLGKKQYFVHRLVAEKYVPNPENKPQVNHINGDKLDNRACNLEWVTNFENREHAVSHLLHKYGENDPCSKLTWADVEYIRRSKKTPNELANMFHVHVNTIRDVLRRRTWVTGEKIC